MSNLKNENKRVINLYSSGNFLSLSKTKYRSIENPRCKSIIKLNDKMPQIINYSYHISEEENKDEIIKSLKDKILLLEGKIKYLEEKLYEKNKKTIEFQPISFINKFQTINTTNKHEILFKSNKDLSRNKLSNFLKNNSNIKIKRNFSMNNLSENILNGSKDEKKINKKNHNLVRSFSQLEKDRLLRTQIKIHCKERKYSPLIPKIPKKYKGDSINNSSTTVNFSNNITWGTDTKSFTKNQIEEQLNKIKIRTENLLKSCFNM